MNEMNEQVFRVAQFGARVGTRMEGQAARARLLEALRSLPEPGRLFVSLDGVEVLSGSFADELIALPYARLTTGEFGDRYMILQTPTIVLAEDLSHKLERRRLAMLCIAGKGWNVLGLIPPPMQETLDLVIEREETTAGDLAEALQIRHNTCLHRVNRLTELRLIRRQEVGLGGPYPTYRFFSIIKS
jgi:hypothetical protein